MRNKRTFDTPKTLIHLVEHCANPSCGCEFWPNNKGRKGKYCSDKCKQEAYRMRKTLAKGKLLVESIREELNRNKVIGHVYEQLELDYEKHEVSL